MPDIDPAALSRTDSLPNGSSSAPALAPIKPPPISAAPAQRSIPRADLEPLYTSLKSAIGEHWTTYKDAVSRFVLGHLSQQELLRQTRSCMASDPHREHLHNQLICAIHTNVFRDPPDATVAGWVSANDKPTMGLAKPAMGDAAELRLKNEVMQLPPRARHRLKGVKDEPRNPLTHTIQLEAHSRRLPTTSASTAHAPASGSNTAQSTNAAANGPSATTAPQGLTKDLDIRRRYALPLMTESRDIPAPSALTDRMLPICYEEGLQSGASPAGSISELLSDAMDCFVKEALAGILSRTRVNPAVSDPASAVDAEAPRHGNSGANANGNVSSSSPSNDSGYAGSNSAAQTAATSANASGAPATATIDLSAAGLGAGSSVQGIATAAYKNRVEAEGRAAARGELKRNEQGLLPVEVEQSRAQNEGRGLPGDLGVAWQMGDLWLAGLVPWVGESLAVRGGVSEWDDEDGADAEHAESSGAMEGIVRQPPPPARVQMKRQPRVPPPPPAMLPPPDNSMALDEADWGWRGGSASDRRALVGLLDDCLAIGE